MMSFPMYVVHYLQKNNESYGKCKEVQWFEGPWCQGLVTEVSLFILMCLLKIYFDSHD